VRWKLSVLRLAWLRRLDAAFIDEPGKISRIAIAGIGS